MPKDTFLNLPDGKRWLIETAALNEFTEHGFDSASINRIVAEAGIAKGSFYQYFDDKADLFMHIIASVSEKKMAYLSPVLMNPADHDFFTLLQELYVSGLTFAKDHPKESRISFEIYKNQTHPVFSEVMAEGRKVGFAFVESLLDKGIKRGEIEPEIDKAFIAQMLMHLQISMLDYYLEDNEETLWADEIMPTVQLMLNFIKNGIQRQNKENNSND